MATASIPTLDPTLIAGPMRDPAPFLAELRERLASCRVPDSGPSAHNPDYQFPRQSVSDKQFCSFIGCPIDISQIESNRHGGYAVVCTAYKININKGKIGAAEGPKQKLNCGDQR